MRCARIVGCVAVGVVGLIAGAASADPATFIYTGFTSGTLDGVEFANRAITITGQADTTNRFLVAGPAWRVTHDSATVAIDGIGVLNVITPTSTAVNNGNMRVVFGTPAPNFALYLLGSDPAFAAWDLTTSIGPLDLAGQFLQWTDGPLATSGGELILNDQTGTGTFQAIVVPAPGAMGAVVLAGVLGARRRR
jgi:hypothetical protein